MAHDEAAKQARMMVQFPVEFYPTFGIPVYGNVDRLYRIVENTIPEPEMFPKIPGEY